LTEIQYAFDKGTFVMRITTFLPEQKGLGRERGLTPCVSAVILFNYNNNNKVTTTFFFFVHWKTFDASVCQSGCFTFFLYNIDVQVIF
jgi:hypothetical protein